MIHGDLRRPRRHGYGRSTSYKFTLIYSKYDALLSGIAFPLTSSRRSTTYFRLIYLRVIARMSAPKQQQNVEHKEKKRKESILDLSKYLEKNIRVKFAGGREAEGILKGYDPLLNLVLDNTKEYLRDPDDPYKLNQDTRMLGLVVCRGTSVVLICPVDGMESIQNPFIQQDG